MGSHYGICLKELRTPNQGEAIVAEVRTCINVSVRHCLFEVDDIWAKENGLDLQAYRERLDCLNFPPKKNGFIPFIFLCKLKTEASVMRKEKL